MKYKYANGAVSAEEAAKFLALTGMAGSVLGELIKRKEIIRRSAELGIRVTDEQMQNFADSYRTAMGLRTADSTMEFLKTWGLTDDDFEAFCEGAAAAELLGEFLATDAKIEDYFANNRAAFDMARVSIIVVGKNSLANELAMQVRQDGEDFHALAREHSVDETTKYAGGYMGLVARDAFDPDVAARVFNASAGDVLGPFPCGDIYRVILVEEIMRADLKRNDVKMAVKEAILSRWAAQFLKGGIRVE